MLEVKSKVSELLAQADRLHQEAVKLSSEGLDKLSVFSFKCEKEKRLEAQELQDGVKIVCEVCGCKIYRFEYGSHILVKHPEEQ